MKTTLVVHLEHSLMPKDLEELKKHYEKESGMKVVILDGRVQKYSIVTEEDNVIVIEQEKIK